MYNRNHHDMITSNDTTGRLMKYDPSTEKLDILKSHLMYPNGVVVSHDGTHLLIAQTSSCQIHKYWIKGPKTGSYEHFVDLPGYPDNIKRNLRGEYWVAMASTKLDDPAGTVPVAFRLNQEGMILEALNGDDSTLISEVSEIDGSLWIGSVIDPFVRVCKA